MRTLQPGFGPSFGLLSLGPHADHPQWPNRYPLHPECTLHFPSLHLSLWNKQNLKCSFYSVVSHKPQLSKSCPLKIPVTSKKPFLSPQRDVILFSINTLNTLFVSYIVLKNSFCVFEVGIHAIPSAKSCSSLQPPAGCFTCSK